MNIKLNKNSRKIEYTLINYSDKNYKKSQKLNTKTAISIGGFDRVISYSLKDIDLDFYYKNRNILHESKGAGYWLWKPYFIRKTFEYIDYGDYLFYCDSGCHFIDSIDKFINSIDRKQDIIPFELQDSEKKWTKRDTFVLMDCDNIKFTDTKQRLASYNLWKKTPFTIKFIDEWLTYALDKRILTDIENQCNKSNYDEFVEHRHDQSIFSLLSKKYNITAYRDPSQFGNRFIEEYPNSKYQQLIKHTRQKDLSFYKSIKKKLRKVKFILIIYNKIKKIYQK